MDEKDILKIKNFDFASYLKDSLNDNDMDMLRLSKLTSIPYWKITKQASLDRNIDFREFLIIMVALNLSPDNLLDLMLEKPQKRYLKRQLVDETNIEELNALKKIIEMQEPNREALFKFISSVIDNLETLNRFISNN